MPPDVAQAVDAELIRQVPWVGATATLIGVLLWWLTKLQRQGMDFFREQQQAVERMTDRHEKAVEKVIDRHDAAERRMMESVDKLSAAVTSLSDRIGDLDDSSPKDKGGQKAPRHTR